MNTYQGYSTTKQLSNTFRNKTMPFYNNTDAYTRKPRSYREARKHHEARKRGTSVSRGTDKWCDVKKKKRYDMKFRSNRRYDKLHIVRAFNDYLDDAIASVVENRYDLYKNGYKHIEKLIKSDNNLSYYDNPVIINELLCSLLNTCEPVVLELNAYDIHNILIVSERMKMASFLDDDDDKDSGDHFR